MRKLSAVAGMILLALALGAGGPGGNNPTSQPVKHLDMPAGWPPNIADIPKSSAEMGSNVRLHPVGGDQPQIQWEIADKPTGFQIFAVTMYYYAGNEFLGVFQRFESNSQLGDMQFPMPPVPTAATRIYVVFRSYTISDEQVKSEWFRDWYSRSYIHFSTAQLVKGQWQLEIWKKHPVDADIETWMTECGVTFAPSIVATTIVN